MVPYLSNFQARSTVQLNESFSCIVIRKLFALQCFLRWRRVLAFGRCSALIGLERKLAMQTISIVGVSIALLASSSVTSKGAELSPETLKAWDAYVQIQNARVAEYSKGAPFLWSDQSPDRFRHLHNREAVVAAFGENPHRVPQGLIHHWIGAVFLPGARLEDVLFVVRDYGKYKDFYAPNVIESRVLRQTGTEDTFSLRMLDKTVVTTFALDTDFRESYRRLNETKWYSIGYTTRVREVENFGLIDEHDRPANTGRGLIWRLYSISRFEQRDGGVYLEVEAIALSRDVPVALRWLVDPIVRRTSSSSINVSLQKTRGAVLERSRFAGNNENGNNPMKLVSSDDLPPDRVQNGVIPTVRHAIKSRNLFIEGTAIALAPPRRARRRPQISRLCIDCESVYNTISPIVKLPTAPGIGVESSCRVVTL